MAWSSSQLVTYVVAVASFLSFHFIRLGILSETILLKTGKHAFLSPPLQLPKKKNSSQQSYIPYSTYFQNPKTWQKPESGKDLLFVTILQFDLNQIIITNHPQHHDLSTSMMRISFLHCLRFLSFSNSGEARDLSAPLHHDRDYLFFSHSNNIPTLKASQFFDMMTCILVHNKKWQCYQRHKH